PSSMPYEFPYAGKSWPVNRLLIPNRHACPVFGYRVCRMRVMFLFLACCLWLVQTANALPVAFGQKEDEFLPVAQAFSLHVERPDTGGVVLSWEIAPGYYLYQERLRFVGLPAGSEPELPPGQPYHDEYFGDSQIYRDRLEIVIPDADIASL